MKPAPEMPVSSAVRTRTIAAEITIPDSDSPQFESLLAAYRMGPSALASSAIQLLLHLHRQAHIKGAESPHFEIIRLLEQAACAEQRLAAAAYNSEKITTELRALAGLAEARLEQMRAVHQAFEEPAPLAP